MTSQAGALRRGRGGEAEPHPTTPAQGRRPPRDGLLPKPTPPPRAAQEGAAGTRRPGTGGGAEAPAVPGWQRLRSTRGRRARSSAGGAAGKCWCQMGCPRPGCAEAHAPAAPAVLFACS